MTTTGTPRPADLVALDGPAVSRLASALRAAGEEMTVVAGPEELGSVAQASAIEVIVIDLTARPSGPKKPAGGFPVFSQAAMPFVIALSAGGAPAEAPLAVDLFLPAEDPDRAVREVRGALALRRLAALAEEVETLRAAVMHARRTAHDLAQPLTTIMARAQLLAGRLKPDDPNARPIGIICEESDRLARLINEFQRLREMTVGASGSQE